MSTENVPEKSNLMDLMEKYKKIVFKRLDDQRQTVLDKSSAGKFSNNVRPVDELFEGEHPLCIQDTDDTEPLAQSLKNGHPEFGQEANDVPPSDQWKATKCLLARTDGDYTNQIRQLIENYGTINSSTEHQEQNNEFALPTAHYDITLGNTVVWATPNRSREKIKIGNTKPCFNADEGNEHNVFKSDGILINNSTDDLIVKMQKY